MATVADKLLVGRWVVSQEMPVLSKDGYGQGGKRDGREEIEHNSE